MARRHGFHGPYHRKPSPRGTDLPRVAGLSGAELKRLLEQAEPTTLPPALGAAPADGMNATERRYAAVLEARKVAGEVAAYWFEGVTLRLAPSTHYRPDFLVLLADGRLEIHEVKGGHVTEDGWIKTKVAAALFPFAFRICQWRDKRWHIVDL